MPETDTETGANTDRQVAFVSGGSRGIGAAIVRELALSGAEVAFTYAAAHAAADTLLAELGSAAPDATVHAYRCDAADFAAVGGCVRQVVADFGRLDLLVNNAGITRDGLALRMSEDDFRAVIDTNLVGAFAAARAAAAVMVKQRRGSIINIASVAGVIGNAGQANYAAAKAGLIGLTKTLARELAPRNITVNAIAPGFIDTDMTRALSEPLRQSAIEHIPLQRFGTPADIARAVAFLSSEAATYITGEVLKIDGGMAM